MLSKKTWEFNWGCKGGYSRYIALIAERKRQQELANQKQVPANEHSSIVEKTKKVQKSESLVWNVIHIALNAIKTVSKDLVNSLKSKKKDISSIQDYTQK